MKLYRVSNHADLSGKGGELAAGRWHTMRPGKRIVYLSEHPALCVLEMLVQVDREADLPDTFQLLSVDVPDSLLQRLTVEDLPELWQNNRSVTQRIGDAWLEGRSTAGLLVPSAVLPISTNCLLNPLLPEVAGFKIERLGRFPLDERLLRSNK